MKKMIMMAFLVGSMHQGAFASASSAPRSDSSGPKIIFDLPGNCPTLKITDPSVARAVKPDSAKDLEPFLIQARNGDVWRVSRDPNETGMALEDIGTFPRLVKRGESNGGCEYFYYYKIDIKGRGIPLLKVILLHKMVADQGK